MATLQDLRAAIDHISACTGDTDAWRRNLSPADLAAVAATVIDPTAATDLLAKIRANHPELFDPRTGASVTPAAAGPHGQDGVAADAMKAAEDALLRQNSRTAEVDLQVITAIANAHSETEQGTERLRQLQQDIENAVRTRADLDTPAGARDFQRYLIGKLREIGAVIEAAGLDSASKTALAGAWTALYRSSAAPEFTPEPDPATPTPAPAVASDAAVVSELPPYGVDTFADPLEDSGAPAVQNVPAAGWSAPSVPSGVPAPTTPPTSGGAPAFPMPGGSPLLSALTPFQPDPLPDNRIPDVTAPSAHRDSDTDELLNDLLGEPSGETGDAAPVPDDPVGETADALPDPGAATRVPLPDGSTLNAPSVALAHVMRDTLAGIPIPDAFRAQDIVVPPPGSSVGLPVEPARVVAGDVGMFMEHQALALDAQRAWLRGQIQPVGAVTGPSFLGWLHPPAPTAMPTGSASPTTAPAAAPGTAR